MVASAITGPWSVGAWWIGIFLSLLAVVYSDDHVWSSIPLGAELSVSTNSTWVSPKGTFAMGFYPALDQAGAYSVGIWFSSIPVEPRTVIWTAGEDLKVGLNARLELTVDGDLVLFDSLHGVSAWRSNTSHSGVAGAVLRDNGNLVLSDNGHKIVWESFNTPSDTLVPGQRLHVGQMLRAASRSSVSSYYNMAMESSGELTLKWESNVIYWKSGTGSLPSDSRPRGAIFAGNGVFGLFDRRGRMVWSRYSNDYTDSKVVLRYLRLDVDGNLRMFSWIEESQSWISGWQAVENQCDVFATCGVYGICTFNSTGPVCKCSFESGIYDATDLNVPSKGCRKPMPLGGCKGEATMLPLKRTVVYNLYPPRDISINTSSDKCRENCFHDDSCVAATVMNDGSGECRLKTGFISGYTYVSVPAISFLKICLVPEAVPNPHQTVDQPTSVNPVQSSSPSNPSIGSLRVCRVCLMGASLGTLGAFLVIEIGVGLYICRRRKNRNNIQYGKHALLNQSSGALIRLSYSEVEELTKKFEHKLGPSIFKGVLPDRKALVIKQLNVEVGEKQFRMTLSLLGSIHHRNLVCLQGFCCECKHRLLIYEHINNGSLDQWLFGGSVKQAKRLNWQRRLDIATGVARAIAYLHSECRECICHGNLKLENVLLDDEFVAKVTDFGLEKLRICAKSNGTAELTPERDVFSFGQMLLEIISGKRDRPECDCPEEDRLCMRTYRAYERGHVVSIPDARLEGNVDWKEVERVLRIAFWCMQEQSFLRPSMNEVVKVLDGTLQVDPPPPITSQGSHLAGACSKLHMPIERDVDKYLELATTSYGTATTVSEELSSM
uniref:Receptor-like serine/threonine-protein kinase n=1 Tax=Araucaria cunninghamii TaxID=56994 RepID=A0A0D6R145_ARACU